MTETAVTGTDKNDRSDKRKTGTQISRNSPFGNPGINQCADTVHQQGNSRIYPDKYRNQNSCSKHGSKVLKT